jgi:hypothetical protein
MGVSEPFVCWDEPSPSAGSTLKRIGRFCVDKQAEIDASRVFTLDFVTEQETKRRYSRAKVIDMVFFQEGINRSR